MDRRKAHNILKWGIVLVFILCALLGWKIPFVEQWQLYEALREMAAIIFAVLGIWITVLHPDALKKIFSKKIISYDEEKNTIEIFVKNIRYTTFILIVILIVGLIASVLRFWILCEQIRLLFRAFSFALLGILTFVQIWSLLMTLAIAESENKKVNDNVSRNDTIKKLLSRSQYQTRRDDIDSE